MRFNPFAASPCPPVACRKSLLCDRLVLPVIPHFFGENGRLLFTWQEADEAIARRQVSLAGQRYLSDELQALASPSDYSSFLFHAAQRLLSVNAHSLADRCIQKGLSLLSSRSPEISTDFDGSLWLVMASGALIRDDLESCRVWLREGRQRFLSSSENTGRLSQSFLRWDGDSCSIDACLQAAVGNPDVAESLLSRACQLHLTAGGVSSAATDLILRSRLRMQGNQWSESVSDLLEAQSFLEPADSVSEEHCRNELRQIIENDLALVHRRMDQLEAANWN